MTGEVWTNRLIRVIEPLIRQAVEEEREACARLAENAGNGDLYGPIGRDGIASPDIARLIRKRGEEQGS